MPKTEVFLEIFFKGLIQYFSCTLKITSSKVENLYNV